MNAEFRKKYLGHDEHLPIIIPEIFSGLEWREGEYQTKLSCFPQPELTTCYGTRQTITFLGDRLAPFHQAILDLGIKAIFPLPKREYVVDNEFSETE